MSTGRHSELHGSSYELFILALSVLSILNLVLLLLPIGSDVKQIVFIVDAGLTLIFLSDFLLRLFSARVEVRLLLPRSRLARPAGEPPGAADSSASSGCSGWASSCGEEGGRRVVRDVWKNRAEGGLLLVALFGILTLEFGGMLVLVLRDPGAEREHPHRRRVAVVGARDHHHGRIRRLLPVTTGGRLVGAVMMIVGVGLFGTFTGLRGEHVPRPGEAGRHGRTRHGSRPARPISTPASRRSAVCSRSRSGPALSSRVQLELLAGS